MTSKVCKIVTILSRLQRVNSWWHSDPIWWGRTGSTLAPSYYLNQNFYSWVRYCALHPISQEMFKVSIIERSLKITWWRHHMETFSALLALCAGNSPVTGDFPAQRPVTRALIFCLIFVWIIDWVNNREAGDLRRHRGHYDIIVMMNRRSKPNPHGLMC